MRALYANTDEGKTITLDELLKRVELLEKAIAPAEGEANAPSDTNTSEAGPSTQTPTNEIDAEGLLKQIEIAEAEIKLMEV